MNRRDHWITNSTVYVAAALVIGALDKGATAQWWVCMALAAAWLLLATFYKGGER